MNILKPKSNNETIETKMNFKFCVLKISSLKKKHTIFQPNAEILTYYQHSDSFHP